MTATPPGSGAICPASPDPLHLLLDEHSGEQLGLVDTLAERVQSLGGVAVGDPRHAAELTSIPRPPDGVEEVPVMLSRLLEAHRELQVWFLAST